MPSQEERIEDLVKSELKTLHIPYYTKTAPINEEIQRALEQAPSKSGGSGRNYPDLKLLLHTKELRKIPVMIEIKGTKGALAKFNKDYSPDLGKEGVPNYDTIKKYALNGALHYANAILDYSHSYNEAIAIGINGYEEHGKLIKEYAFYYLHSKHLAVPQKIGDFNDLSILAHLENLQEKIDTLTLSEEARAKKIESVESETQTQLSALDQFLYEKIEGLNPNKRIALLVGMVMAALGVKDKIAPLMPEDLKSEQDEEINDGKIFSDRIKIFLKHKNLPKDKIVLVMHELNGILSTLWSYKKYRGTYTSLESPLKKIYIWFREHIFPLVKKLSQADIAGRLFNCLTRWLKITEDDRNDVVLTPRVVVDLMVELAQVNRNSYVWDYATGSGAFLVSSMNKMIKDCIENIDNPQEREKKSPKLRANSF
ncbi:N-6 DNA methylase [Helicobacter bizzozeronii]|uniref:N-6 DNA methylase n=1 Tax=Helicobacter bizzozeronii TaxID=56877 RepID=UPI0022773852|nr:N-6 DNA methylase [Helicobacter bizzozeronii]